MGATVGQNGEIEMVASTEPERVFLWRLGQFMRMGVEPNAAQVLAGSRVDVREYEQLVQSGCCWQTAVRILL